MKPYKTIQVSGETLLAPLLDEARDVALVLERDGERYTPERAKGPGMPAGYDVEKARQALDATVGTWADVDAEELISQIYRWREEGTRPPDR
ncbi:MAG: hypothetical protein JOZ41_06695 [Chloroflexi bacterium]|nr:hypothetical protein [Chloroflexota bacterium]